MNIVLQKIESSYRDSDGEWFARVSMFANDKGIALPETGETVKGLSDYYHIAPGSSIFTADGNIIFRGIDKWGEWL